MLLKLLSGHQRTRTTLLLGLVALLGVTGSLRADPAARAAIELRAKLIANKDSYLLPADRQGEKFRAAIKAAEEKGELLPPTPAVDLVLELTNPTDQALELHFGG